jgi:hypothetical protein
MLNNDKYCHKKAKHARNFVNRGTSRSLPKGRQVHGVSIGNPEKNPGIQGWQPMAIQEEHDRGLANEKLKYPGKINQVGQRRLDLLSVQMH